MPEAFVVKWTAAGGEHRVLVFVAPRHPCYPQNLRTVQVVERGEPRLAAERYVDTLKRRGVSDARLEVRT